MDVLRIAARALVAYFYLLVMERWSGKRSVAQATPFDFVVALIIGDLVDDALWAEVPVSQFAAAAGSIFLVDIGGKMAAARSRRFFDLVSGKPAVVLRSGVEQRDALRHEQLNESDLAHLLRNDGIDDWSEVRLAVVESNSELSVMKEAEKEGVTRADRVVVKEKLG